jgi:hypothetical protein
MEGLTLVRVHIPMPLQIVIDDVGWWCGEDGHERQEPYRTGIDRPHAPEDYAAIVSLGRKLAMRPQAAMVLCEWDRDDLLRAVPSATWMGTAWSNARWRGPWLDRAAEIIRAGAAHVELTLHGLGHEYWTDGRMTRAEWYDKAGQMRPRDQVEAHLDACEKLLARNALPRPESFVPCAFYYTFADDSGGMTARLRGMGVKYLSTPFSHLHNAGRTQEKLFGIEAGVMIVDRGTYPMSWRAIGPTPSGPVEGPILGLHWPNVLAADPARNEEVVDRWVEFLRPYGRRPDRLLARDTAEAWTQLAHHHCTQTRLTGAQAQFDFTRLTRLPPGPIGDEFTVKVEGASDRPLRATGLAVTADSTDPRTGLRTLRLRRDREASQAVLEFADGGAMP